MLAFPIAGLALALLPASDRAAALGAEARGALAGGSSSAALAKAEEALEWSPDDLALLDLASQAAEADKEPDRALCYAAQALELATAPENAALAEALKKRIGELDPLAGKDQALLGDYAAALLALGNDCVTRKLWVNAVELLGRTQGSPSAAAGEAALAKIYSNRKAVEALLDSGLDVPLQEKKRRGSAAKAAEEDKKHSDWEHAWEIKGDCYTVKTDLSRDLAEQMSRAMEQMNAYYRKVFHVKEHGGGDTARVTICVYRTRKEFDEHEDKPDEHILGFFVPNVNRVATYDPRDEGRALSDLWSTLFHESSHQFTHLISADLIPSWLNEGTASFFEGARLLPNGAVETNLVPEMRLKDLPYFFKQGKPGLEEVVSWFKPGSYEGEYYPFGWGLVYFLQNYENDKSQRIYEPLYHDYMAAYKSGGKHDVLGRFVEYFVTKAKDPAVKNFADFEARWRKWIQELDELYEGPPEKADALVARGRKQRADKQLDSAVESFRWALRKRPGDVLANFELGETLSGLKLVDAALFHYQKCVQAVRALADPQAIPPGAQKKAAEIAADAQARIGRLNKDLADKLAKAGESFVGAASTTAQAYVDKGLPLYALRFLARAESSFGGSRALAELRGKLAQASAVDTRRWRRFPLEPKLAGWEGSDDFTLEGDDIRVGKEGGGFLWAAQAPQIPYRLEARFETADTKEACVAGWVFGANDQNDVIQGVLVYDKAVLISEYGKKGWDTEKDALLGMIEARKAWTLALEVREGEVEAFVDGTSVGKRSFEPAKLRGGVGLYDEGAASFRELRVRD